MLACAEFNEVFGCFGDDIVVEEESYPAKRLNACLKKMRFNVKKHFCHLKLLILDM
jgi:hypothetical protein